LTDKSNPNPTRNAEIENREHRTLNAEHPTRGAEGENWRRSLGTKFRP